ncbi:MAG: hypothetical protein BWY73_01384 [candidate division TA06 bacterium ADurb.Bin417]|uniref:Uncharacterized protein n=1 Tax=candidate division TA06 bacterium ADurb.Bin417 TaxID=1852828 RepID=A0A1V5MA45_UNCT6|nr:MAG: hypothetical protein BWY73_01384 [candidate division TA06 bacterium ADurb.Bin417]
MVLPGDEIGLRSGQVEENRRIVALERFTLPVELAGGVGLVDLPVHVEQVAVDAVSPPGAQGPLQDQALGVVTDRRKEPLVDTEIGLGKGGGQRIVHLLIRPFAEVAGDLLGQDDLLAPFMPEGGLLGDLEGGQLHGHQGLRLLLRPPARPFRHVLDRGAETDVMHDGAELAAGTQAVVGVEAVGIPLAQLAHHPVVGVALLNRLVHPAADLHRVAVGAVDVAVGPVLPADKGWMVADPAQDLAYGGPVAAAVVEDQPAELVGHRQALLELRLGTVGPVGVLAGLLQEGQLLGVKPVAVQVVVGLAADRKMLSVQEDVAAGDPDLPVAEGFGIGQVDHLAGLADFNHAPVKVGRLRRPGLEAGDREADRLVAIKPLGQPDFARLG